MPQPAAENAEGSNIGEYTVTELSGAIKRAIEDGFGYVRLRGEISGYRGPHASGHCYFGLKDEKAKIDAVIWRGSFSRLRFKPEEGMEVIAQGKVTTYPGSSKYQIVIETLEPAGLGALMALLEERKKKFAAEGLFNEDRKRPLPFLPRVVGIVTSPTGAVIRDMLHGFEERFPAHVIVWPVRVQGETCAAEVARAVTGFNTMEPGASLPRPDVIIVARGGGSLEDLWGFNEEEVVRAVADSNIPVISAVGHETDWTLIDLVADARAPTPTKAAEWAVPKYGELIEDIEKLTQRLTTAIRRTIEASHSSLKAAERGLPRTQDVTAFHRQHYDAVERRLASALLANTRTHTMRLARPALRLVPRLLSQRIGERNQQLDGLSRRCSQALYRLTSSRRTRYERVAAAIRSDTVRTNMRQVAQRITNAEQRARNALKVICERRHRQLDANAKLLETLSYRSVLSRGYAVVRDDTGQTVKHVAEATPGKALSIELTDGKIAANVSGGGAGVDADATSLRQTRSSASPPDARLQQPKSDRRTKAKPKSKGEQGSLF